MYLLITIAVSCLCTHVIGGNVDLNSTNSVTGSVSDTDDDAYYPSEEWSDTFDWQLMKVFADSKYKNVIISPISLKLVLGLLYEGSSGTTEREFQNVMHFPVDKEKNRENFKKILESLLPSERKEYILNLGTRIFMDSAISPQQNFAARAKHNYQTDIELLNFENGTNAAGAINSWVDILTNGRIPSLVSSDEVDNSIMLIVNALFFKGSWRHGFPRNRTELGGFYVSPNEVVDVPLMKTTNKFFYFESNTLDAKILRLPYKGKKYSMYIVLPNSKAGLNDLLRKITLESLKKNLYYMDNVPVELILPKLKFDFKMKCTKILEEFGLRQMFQNTASFSGIARGENKNLRMLYVSDIIQKSGIQLNEEGSTVYAATDVQVTNKFGEVDNIFNATHPFMFFIEEQTKGTILFVGKVENPLHIATIGTRGAVDIPEQVLNLTLPTSEAQLDLEPQNNEAAVILRRFNYFDLELLQEFSEFDRNIIVSPASIKTTLSMILEGAKGKCAQEIGNALRIDDINNAEIRKQLQRLLFDINDENASSNLTTVNAIFYSDKLKIVPEYQKKLTEYYHALIEPIDFANPVKSIDRINDWIKNTTNGTIPPLISENLVEESTVVIVNAMNFLGKWKTAFNPEETSVQCFNTPNLGCKKVLMMRNADTMNYSLVPHLNAHAVELPYQGDKMSMLLLIPAQGTNVKILARDMQHAHFENILDQLRPTELILEVPIFEIETEISLVPFLRPLKIQEIFGINANLSGIVSDINIRIGNILHKARVEVDEEGTKAAAATSAVVIPLMGEIGLKVSADRPFIFFIYQKESKNIIFEGILYEPRGPKQHVPTPSPPVEKPIDQGAKIIPNFRNRYTPVLTKTVRTLPRTRN